MSLLSDPQAYTYKPDPTVIAEQLFGDIEWKDSLTGYMECPGKDLHSTPTGKRDCRIKLDGAPTLSCFHNTCVNVLAPLNLALRRALPSGKPRPLSTGYRREQVDPSRERRLAEKAAKSLPGILEKFSKPLEDSPTKLAGNSHRDAVLFLELFNPDDVVWIGNKLDSAADDQDDAEKNRCRVHFAPAQRWMLRLSRARQSDSG